MRIATLQEREERYIRRVLAVMGGSVGMTAKVLGIGRATLYRRLLEMGFNLADAQQRKLDARRLQKRLEYLGRPARTM